MAEISVDPAIMSSSELCVEEGNSKVPIKQPPIKYYLISLLCHCVCLPKCILLVRLVMQCTMHAYTSLVQCGHEKRAANMERLIQNNTLENLF